MSTKAYENPLIPNLRLRAMYVAMVEARLLGKSLVTPASKRKGTPSIPNGLEALWTATAIGLRDSVGDLVSEPGVGPALDLVLGTPLKAIANGKASASAHRLPVLGAAFERVQMALGAAMALKAAAQKNLVLVYLEQADLTRPQWRTILGTALAGELPVVFVVAASANFDLALLSQRRGVPGIAVEATDAIALYRVAQESIVRARADGGPALIAGVPFHAGLPKKKPVDPVALLGGQLLRRRVCNQAWLDGVERKATAHLAR